MTATNTLAHRIGQSAGKLCVRLARVEARALRAIQRTGLPGFVITTLKWLVRVTLGIGVIGALLYALFPIVLLFLAAASVVAIGPWRTRRTRIDIFPGYGVGKTGKWRHGNQGYGYYDSYGRCDDYYSD